MVKPMLCAPSRLLLAAHDESRRWTPPKTEARVPRGLLLRTGSAPRPVPMDGDEDLRKYLRKPLGNDGATARLGGTGDGHLFGAIAGADGSPVEARDLARATIEGQFARVRYVEADDTGLSGRPVRVQSTFEVDRLRDAEALRLIFRNIHGWRFEMYWLRHWWEPEP